MRRSSYVNACDFFVITEDKVGDFGRQDSRET